MIKVSVVVGLFAVVPQVSWAAPVSSSPASGITTLAEAQRGLVFGGFFTLYSFAVARPLVPAVTGLPSSAAAAAAGPTVGSPAAVIVVDDGDGDGAADAADLPGADLPVPLLIEPGPAVLALVADDALLLPRPTLPGVGDDAARPGRGSVLPAATAVPEPSTLLLVALAGLALIAAGRKPVLQQQKHASR